LEPINVQLEVSDQRVQEEEVEEEKDEEEAQNPANENASLFFLGFF
jgi:hypothetical protein